MIIYVGFTSWCCAALVICCGVTLVLDTMDISLFNVYNLFYIGAVYKTCIISMQKKTIPIEQANSENKKYSTTSEVKICGERCQDMEKPPHQGLPHNQHSTT